MNDSLRANSPLESRVFLLGKPRDLHLEAIASACQKAGDEAHILNSRQAPCGPPLSIGLSDRRVLIDNRPVRALFARHLPPIAPALTRPERFSRAQCTKAIREGAEIRDAWVAALSLLDEARIPVLNAPFHWSLDQHKTRQLLSAKKAGLNVPETHLETGPTLSSPPHKGYIQKGLRGGEVHAPRSRKGAYFLQHKAAGIPVRVTMLDQQVLASAKLEGASTLDYRVCPRFQSGTLPWTPFECPKPIARALARLGAGLNLRFHASDFIVDERWMFLEMNPSPAWLDVERDLGIGITQKIASALLGEN